MQTGWLLRHGRQEIGEQIAQIVGPRAGLGMALEAEGGLVAVTNALDRPVEQRPVGHLKVRRQRVRIQGEPMVLTGDGHLAGCQMLYGVVGAMVPKLHFLRAPSSGQPQQLVSKADTEQRNLGCKQASNGFDRVVTRLRIARAIAQ